MNIDSMIANIERKTAKEQIKKYAKSCIDYGYNLKEAKLIMKGHLESINQFLVYYLYCDWLEEYYKESK